MKQLIAQQVQFILLMTMSGMSLMAGYDLLRLFRWLIPHGEITIAVEDLLYWMVVSVPVFYLFLEFHDGLIRWYGLVSVFGGIVLYEYGLSRPVRSRVGGFFNRVRKKWQQKRKKVQEEKRKKRQLEEEKRKQRREELEEKRRQRKKEEEERKRQRQKQEEEKRRQKQNEERKHQKEKQEEKGRQKQNEKEEKTSKREAGRRKRRQRQKKWVKNKAVLTKKT